MPFDPPATDEALLAAYAAGDGAAARVLVGRLAPRILRLARRLLADPAEAEDVTQEALLRLWQMAPRWQAQGASPATWLHRVAVNLATDRLRRRRGPGLGPGLDEIDEPEDDTPGPAEALIQADRLAALDAALARLPDRQRAAVVLRHLEGMTNPEIALELGIGVEAVESLTARGKRRLAQLLAGRRDDLGYDR
jgi:RNA polymerase sigma-70 factor (ECF subfamily)